VDIGLLCTASADGTVRYELRVTKDGAGGRSVIRQSGTGEVIAGEEKLLSRARIGVISGDRCVAGFEVSAGGHSVSRGTVELPECSLESISLPRHREGSGEENVLSACKMAISNHAGPLEEHYLSPKETLLDGDRIVFGARVTSRNRRSGSDSGRRRYA
jgi:hypothetical protein